MRTKHTKFAMALLILTMCLAVFAPIALAAEVHSGEIPVTISLSGSPPMVDEDYKIIIKADNSIFPMPSGSENGTFSMTITGADTGKLPEIEFSSLGVYTYTIFQEVGTNEMCTYDDSKYNLIVSVTNSENGSGLETAVILYKQGKSEKFDEVVFHNEYDEEIIDIPDEETPLGPIELPKTGTQAMTILSILGFALLGAGSIGIYKSKKK